MVTLPSASKCEVAKKSVKKDVQRAAKNVSRNVKAVKRAVKAILPKKTAKKAAKKVASKKRATNKRISVDSYQLRDAPFVTGKTALQKLHSLEKNAERFDSLKKDDEVWAFSYYGYNSLRTFRTAQQAVSRLLRYEATDKYGNSLNKEGEELIDGIKLMKVPETNRVEYKSLKDTERKERKEKRGKVMSTLSEMFGSTNAQTKQKKTTTDYMADLLERVRQLEESNTRMLEELKGGKSRNATKKTATKKRSGKKTAKSKTAKKSATRRGQSKAGKKSVPTKAKKQPTWKSAATRKAATKKATSPKSSPKKTTVKKKASKRK